MKDVIAQLKALKHRPEAGAADVHVKEQIRARLLSAIEHHETEGQFVAEGVAYYRWIFSDFISKPMVVGVAAFVFLFGGWMTSVNAASNSLPGDTLYTLKLVTERARLKLASAEHRALLHTEFAQRRYEEVQAIRALPEKEEYVEATLSAFNEQITLAQTELESLSASSDETVAVANAVDQQIGELNDVIDEVAADTTTVEDATQVADARESTQIVENTVIDAIVSTHDADPNLSHEELDALFREELVELRARAAFDLGRLGVIEATIANDPALLDFELPIGESLNVLEFRISQSLDGTGDAMNFAAASGYRAAFDILEEANTHLLAIENQLALVEIAILDTKAAAKAAAEATSAEDQTQESIPEITDSQEDA